MFIKFIIAIWIIYKIYRHFKGKKLTLDEKSVVLISGCSRGLGESTARKLIKKYNCTLINISRTGIESLRASLSEKQNSNVHHYECDISDETKLAETLVEIRRKFRIPDLIINNAAINSMGYFLENQDNENLKKTLNTNALGHIQLTRFFMFEYLSRLGMKPKFNEEAFGVQDPQRNSSIRLKRRKLTFAFITSVVSETPTLRFPSYSMSKALLQSFVENLRLEINHFKLSNMINVVSILPGAFDSKMFSFFKSFLSVRLSTVDQISDSVISNIMSLEERAYAPFHMRLQVGLPKMLIPEALHDKISLLINRKCMKDVLEKVIKEKEE
jgi:NAD(P)-dependent dehydrogenase (short-subunit alcohol dehydrogenase family)